MCGILFTLSTTNPPPSPSHASLISFRGPDSTRTHNVCSHNGGKFLSFTSSLLSLRGKEPVSQPLVDPSTGSVLCWNGEAWRIDDVPLQHGVNDTIEVLHLLLSAPDGHIEEVLGCITGEYSFVFYHGISGSCWFGRDWAGRRSLVMRRNETELTVASVGDSIPGEPWEEVKPGGVWKIDVDSGVERWISNRRNSEPIYCIPRLNMGIPSYTLESNISRRITISSQDVLSLEKILRDSVALRVQDIPHPPEADLKTRSQVVCENGDDVRLAVLFSGGVDCTTIARIAHEVLPINEPVDLLNVAFENPRAIASRNNLRDPQGKDISPKNYEAKGIESTPCNLSAVSPTHTNVLAELDPYVLCPDRITGLSSFLDLCQTCPSRQWRFISIDISYSEVLAHRSTVISLMHPHNTEMDLSIALAFYFASRGSGNILRSGSSVCEDDKYTTPARVLLSGFGADEIFGGYTRHATAFRRHGYSGLLSELDLDFQRLGTRNLGRDDRVTSYWAKEMRYPFLDERVVSWAMAAPVESKCPFGEGEDQVANGKKVLRLVAEKLGLHRASREAKRAVQFGARSAKMSLNSRKVKGTDGLVL